MLLLAKYWKELVIAVLLIAFAITVKVLNSKIESLVKDKEALQSKLDTQKAYAAVQNASILQNKSDYDEAMKKLPTVLKTIETKYQTVYSTIEKWKESNATDCNSSMQYLNSYQY